MTSLHKELGCPNEMCTNNTSMN